VPTAAPWSALAGTAHRFDAATRELDPPLAVVDLDAFQDNAAQLVRRARGVPIRLATKSVRSRELLRIALDTPGFSGLMCYSLAEALWLHGAGLSDDILVAYPTTDRSALRALVSDPAAAAAITVTVDSEEHLNLIDAVEVGVGRAEVRVCLELDAA
jgi:D-serine deaminase-like pyridoxal phosphate-dependent protein